MARDLGAQQHRSMGTRFDAYVERCLYDPDHGFYRGGGGAAGGRSGDFLTSPEVGPLFAEVLGRALDHWWDELGRPEPFCVFDAGTGPGTLRDQLAIVGGGSKAVRRVVGFDQGELLPAELAGAVVIANEVLDNIAFRIVERTPDGWGELFVTTDDTGRLSEDLLPCDLHGDEALVRLGGLPGIHDLAVGTRVPVYDGARTWIRELLDRGPALVVAFDYGAPTTVELARRGGWVRTYRGHQRGSDPLAEPGRWDITTDVGFDQLPQPTSITTQANFLRGWGIEELTEEGREYWRAHAASPDVAAMKMRSRVREAEALLEPDGLGSWMVAMWSAGPLPNQSAIQGRFAP